MYRPVLLILLGLAMGSPWPPILLAEEPDETLTLAEAVDAAIKNNPQVLVARHAADAAAARITTARSGLLPQVDVAETFNRTNSPLWAFGTKLNQGSIESEDFAPDALNEPDAINNFNTALTLSWNLYDGGRTRIGWDQARQGREAADLGLVRATQQVIAQAARAYVGLLLARENLVVIEQSLDTSRAQLRLVEDRFDGGLAVKSDVLRARVHIAQLEQQRLAAGSQVQVAQAVLYAAMGREDSGSIAPTTSLENCLPTRGAMDEWIERALTHRPDLRQVDIQAAVAEQGIARAEAGHLPRLDLHGNYEHNSEDFSESQDNYTVGAVVRVNLYSGRRISSEAATARSTAAEARAARRARQLAVRVETQRAYYLAQSTWQSIDVARQAVLQAEEGLRIVGNRYAGGLLTIVDLLDAQVALQQARTLHYRAMHDYKVARIELALAAGTISRDFR